MEAITPAAPDRVAFYLRHYGDMLEPLSALMRHGIRVDVEGMAKLRGRLLSEAVEWQEKVDEWIGAHKCQCGHHKSKHREKRVNIYARVLRKDGKPRVPKWKSVYRCRIKKCACTTFEPRVPSLRAKTDLSTPRIKAWLYETMRMPVQKKMGKVAADEFALRRLVLLLDREIRSLNPRATLKWKKRPKLCKRVILAILEVRDRLKMAGALNPKNLTGDILYCQYGFDTKTGRLKSKKNPKDRGLNLQNPDRRTRNLFIPYYPDWWIVEFDLSQAEDRVVKVLTGDPDLIERARALPGTNDEHKRAASVIYRKPVDQIAKPERTAGKTFRHANNYGAGAQKVADTFLKASEGETILTRDFCAKSLQAIAEADPGVPRWQKNVRLWIIREGYLETSWGRRLSFHNHTLNEDLYREAYAFQPQSEVGDLLNQYGLIPLYNYIKKKKLKTLLHLQVHDSLVMSCPAEEVYRIMRFVWRSFDRERIYQGPYSEPVKLKIPVEFKVAKTWGPGMSEKWIGREWNCLPSKDEVMKELRAMQEEIGE